MFHGLSSAVKLCILCFCLAVNSEVFSGSIVIRPCPLSCCFPCPGLDVHYLEIMQRSACLAAREAESRPAVQQGWLQDDARPAIQQG